MTVVTIPLGVPRPAAQRGADCRARDLTQDRNVYGPHRFATPADCQISNGLMRLTLSASGSTPSLLVEVRRPPRIINDAYSDAYVDAYGGTVDPAAWLAAGSVVIDSPTVTATVEGAAMERVHPDLVAIRVLSRALGDVVVTLRRGERLARVHHGASRLAPSVSRRLRWTANPSPVGSSAPSRIEETTQVLPEFLRHLATLEAATVDVPTFALTVAPRASARFGAGVGRSSPRDTPESQHRQLADTSPLVVV